MQELLEQAKHVQEQHFGNKAHFERSIFFSWGCTIGDCAFCYMSTQPEGKKPRETKRSLESMYAEVLLARELNWDIGFLTGGIGVYTPNEMEEMLQGITSIYGEKVWLSIGPIPKQLLERFKPYLKGIVGSTETINPDLHKIICPSKPLAPYERMFQDAITLDIPRSMTFIIGLGETKEDFKYLESFITKNQINKIHIYGLKPRKGTMFEDAPIPTKEQQAWWVAKLRTTFPEIHIQCGIWEDRIERSTYLLEAGGNALSNFRATKLFGTVLAKEVEEAFTNAGRTCDVNLTSLPDKDWDTLVEDLPLEKEMKVKVRKKLQLYIERMQENMLTAKS